MESLHAVQAQVEALAARIDAPPHLLPTYGRSDDGARPHLEIDDRYHFVVVERGQELERRSTDDLDELLYWVMGTTTFSMACAHELRHRREGVDFRRLLFAKQVEWLRRLSPDWAERKQGEHAETLKLHPFTDEKRPGFGWFKKRN